MNVKEEKEQLDELNKQYTERKKQNPKKQFDFQRIIQKTKKQP